MLNAANRPWKFSGCFRCRVREHSLILTVCTDSFPLGYFIFSSKSSLLTLCDYAVTVIWLISCKVTWQLKVKIVQVSLLNFISFFLPLKTFVELLTAEIQGFRYFSYFVLKKSMYDIAVECGGAPESWLPFFLPIKKPLNTLFTHDHFECLFSEIPA